MTEAEARDKAELNRFVAMVSMRGYAICGDNERCLPPLIRNPEVKEKIKPRELLRTKEPETIVYS